MTTSILYHQRHERSCTQSTGWQFDLGPDLVALNDPALIPIIYNARGTFGKIVSFTSPWHILCNVAQGLYGRNQRMWAA